ncbi:hypothetical protein BH24BAC1_BH24BAC1_25340 [soil metagenome]
MDTQERNKIRKRLICRIESLSDDKLGSLENYLDELEAKNSVKDEILAFAGIFSDLDNEFINDLTTDLPDRRQEGDQRIK